MRVQIPIESPDIRYVYLLETSGHRIDREPKRDPRIQMLKRKIVEGLKARAALLKEEKS